MAKYKVVEAVQKSQYKDGFYWKVKALGEDGKDYEGDLWKAIQPEVGKKFESNLEMTDWGYSFKKVVWEGEVAKKSYTDNRIKYDLTKEEKIAQDKERTLHISRQGFINQAMALFPLYKGDIEKWIKDMEKLEAIYTTYISKGEL
jgi:hypothetical protein